MGKEPAKNQNHSFRSQPGEFRVTRTNQGWRHPVHLGTWQQWLVPLYRRMDLWKKWHMGQFPIQGGDGDFDPVVLDDLGRGESRSGQKQDPAGRVLGWRETVPGCRPADSRTPEDRDQDRVREWVAAIPDLETRLVAYYLFVALPGLTMGPVELARILGVSPCWVGRKIAVLLEERIRLVRGDNHSGELSA